MLRCDHCDRNFAASDAGLIERTVHELACHAN